MASLVYPYNFRMEFQFSDHCASSSQIYSSVARFSSCAIEEQLPIEKHSPSIHCKHRVGSHHLCRTHKKWAPTPHIVHSLLEFAATRLHALPMCAMHFPHTFQISSHNIDGNHQFNPLQNILQITDYKHPMKA